MLCSNDFDSGDIAILVPYTRQLGCLKERLTRTGTCSIILSDKDKEDLVKLRLLDGNEQQRFRSNVGILPMVRLVTIDSFQGEEAKVVILSTVRSNRQDRVGFLQTTNRINVACSRARNGFYIVGNSNLLRTVQMWGSIIANFQSKARIGPSFVTHCSRHPHLAQAVSRPEQFQKVKPCDKRCGYIFACGHRCPEKCHEPALHSRIRCREPCARIHAKCGHKCTKKCGEPCGDCSQTVMDEKVPCGHPLPIKCADLGLDIERKCTATLEPIVLSCGHSVERTCSSKDEPMHCKAQCEHIHQCGHQCSAECHECQENQVHSRCAGVCGKKMACGHICVKGCHSGPCLRCEQPCIRSCEHGKVCRKACYVVCDPCVQRCLKKHCGHGSCSTVCSLPCGQLPCPEPCALLLPCAHVCPGLCGERCASVCQQCETGELPSETKIFLSCGHSYNVADLDTKLGISNVMELGNSGEILALKGSMGEKCMDLARCPQCEAPCDDVRRYRHLGQFRVASNTIDRFYNMFGRKMKTLAEKITTASEQMDSGFKLFCEHFEPGPLAGSTNATLIKARLVDVMPIQTQVTRFRGKSINEGHVALGQLANLDQMRLSKV